MRHCTLCDRKLPDMAAQCPECGTSVARGGGAQSPLAAERQSAAPLTKECPACAKSIPAEARHCPECGRTLKPEFLRAVEAEIARDPDAVAAARSSRVVEIAVVAIVAAAIIMVILAFLNM